jgi:hypothetical protein
MFKFLGILSKGTNFAEEDKVFGDCRGMCDVKCLILNVGNWEMRAA